MKAQLLIVAPDTELRWSLAGALEAAGHEVTVREQLPPRAWLAKQRFACTVLDQRLLIGEDYESIAFCIKAHPVVLIAEHPHPWLVEWIAGAIAPQVAVRDVAGAVSSAMQLDV
jgi:DNA-binding NtrC family response regulator